MCLAIPAQIEEIEADKGRANLAGNRIDVILTLTPDVKVGDWVLVHAGCAITLLNPQEAKETFDLLKQIK